MKVLWVTNVPFDHHNDLLCKKDGAIASGSWLYAAYESAKNDARTKLFIVTVANISDVLFGEYDGNEFYVLPGGTMSTYKVDDKKNIEIWASLKEKIRPDLVFIWGTESKFSYVASEVFSDTPQIVYIQGLLSSIVQHYFDGIPSKFHIKTLRDYANIILHRDAYIIYKQQVPLERVILKNARAVVVENDWCESQCLTYNRNLKVFRNFLPIRHEYYERRWNAKDMNRYTVFTNAGGATIKGHHILYKAIAKVKEKYPQVKVYIPGYNYLEQVKQLSKRSGYIEYLYRIYKENKLDENIEFTGLLTAKEMANYIASCNVYVMPSMVENHSSSLIEAMIVGAPCVSSLVGGTANLIRYGENGYLYNSLEAVTLSGYIIRLFDDENLAKALADEAVKIRQSRELNFGESMIEIYKSMNNSKKFQI